MIFLGTIISYLIIIFKLSQAHIKNGKGTLKILISKNKSKQTNFYVWIFIIPIVVQ
jgi:hypothetical protein